MRDLVGKVSLCSFRSAMWPVACAVLCLVAGGGSGAAAARQQQGNLYNHPSLLEDSWLSDVITNVVLLQDSGGRHRRQATDAAAADTSNNKGFLKSQEDAFLKNVDLDQDVVNKTLKKSFKDHGLNVTDNDTHKYYNFTFKEDGTNYFIDLDSRNTSGKHAGQVKEHSMLSQSYRRAATITLSFKFPFYGYEVGNITIATGGFLFTGDYVHSWLAATQYIAPLMANFDTSSNHNAKIRYLDTGDFLVVEWKDVYLQEKEGEGSFTFQVILHNNGDIEFAYHQIPLTLTQIHDEEHPVKIGLSDAYIIDRTIFFVRRKTIYEYHRVNMKNHNISSKTAIIFKSLPTCNVLKSCEYCLQHHYLLDLKCRWCPALGRCSDGMDRGRQEWLTYTCSTKNISSPSKCPPPGQAPPIRKPHGNPDNNLSYEDAEAKPRNAEYPVVHQYKVNPGGLATLIVLSVLVILVFGWVGYAYFYPHTWSGQILIKYRPGAWRWRQGGARYTAASIHM